jgi:hypothetical protein
MIDENGRGVLIDWELAIRVKDENGTLIESKARQHDRTVSHSPASLWPLVSNFIHRVPGNLCRTTFLAQSPARKHMHYPTISSHSYG